MEGAFSGGGCSQKDPGGKAEWPVAARDRLAYFQDSSGAGNNVAVTFLWTMRDAVLPKLGRGNLALAANFYTPAGLEGMIRNILGNPCIRYVVLFGEEHAANSVEGDRTSANALRAFFEKGLGPDRKLPGFESAVHVDANIPAELIEAVRKNVELIDINRAMPGAPLGDKIDEANRMLSSLGKKPPFLDRPYAFGYEETEEPMPYEGGPVIVHGSNIPRTWVEIMHIIFRYGRENLMNANTERWVKEISNLVAVIHSPQDMDISFNPFLVPMTKERIDAYCKEILSAELPPGKAYTYGNKLRAYYHPLADDIRNLVGSREFRDFEFGRGPHLDANVKYLGKACEINQVSDIIDVLKRDLYSKACIAVTWHAHDELMRKHKSSPCLVLLQAMVQDEKLNLTAFFRSHDMAQGWPENAYGCAAIQREIAGAIGLKPGPICIISGSAQIYRNYYQQAKEMLQRHRKTEDVFNEQRGNFAIDVREGKIAARLMHPETGKELECFEGATPKEVYTKIAFNVSGLQLSHAIYLGTELQKAYESLKRGAPYEQDAELKS